jgi:hypothetical protein
MKLCSAPNCTYGVFGKGYCKIHQYLREDFDKRSIAQKGLAKAQKALRELKNLPDNKEAVRNVSSLDAWFKKAAEVIAANPHCWNCGEFIPEKYYRHASAHIFPKAHFFSVSINPNNLLVLGAGCGCHFEHDSSIEKACKMQIWPIAVERFKTFEKEIREKHKYLDLFKSKIGSG